MDERLKKYYGDKHIVIGLSNYDSFDSDFTNLDDGPGTCSNGNFEYKAILERPDDDGIYFDSYEEIKEYDLEAVILLRKYTIWDDEEDIEFFNEYFSTDFETFEECYDYASLDEDGPNLSSNVFELDI